MWGKQLYVDGEAIDECRPLCGVEVYRLAVELELHCIARTQGDSELGVLVHQPDEVVVECITWHAW